MIKSLARIQRHPRTRCSQLCSYYCCMLVFLVCTQFCCCCWLCPFSGVCFVYVAAVGARGLQRSGLPCPVSTFIKSAAADAAITTTVTNTNANLARSTLHPSIVVAACTASLNLLFTHLPFVQPFTHSLAVCLWSASAYLFVFNFKPSPLLLAMYL